MLARLFHALFGRKRRPSATITNIRLWRTS